MWSWPKRLCIIARQMGLAKSSESRGFIEQVPEVQHKLKDLKQALLVFTVVFVLLFLAVS